MPKYPLHPKCHCKAEQIYEFSPKAECGLVKFTEYIFNPDPLRNKGKKVMFEAWGYSIIDSEWLQGEFVRQANEKYLNADFVLPKLTDFGQRINIRIDLYKKDREEIVSINTGWMVYPDGIIKLITPFVGG